MLRRIVAIKMIIGDKYKYVSCHNAGMRLLTVRKNIADFWGWEKTDPNINADNKGVSLVLVNTEKGRELFEAVKDQMTVIPAKLEDCLQPNLCRPSFESHRRCKFEKDYRKYGFKYVYYRYGNIGPIWRLRQIKAFFKKNLRLR